MAEEELSLFMKKNSHPRKKMRLLRKVLMPYHVMHATNRDDNDPSVMVRSLHLSILVMEIYLTLSLIRQSNFL